MKSKLIEHVRNGVTGASIVALFIAIILGAVAYDIVRYIALTVFWSWIIYNIGMIANFIWDNRERR